jgi:hypothetical protein
VDASPEASHGFLGIATCAKHQLRLDTMQFRLRMPFSCSLDVIEPVRQQPLGRGEFVRMEMTLSQDWVEA